MYENDHSTDQLKDTPDIIALARDRIAGIEAELARYGLKIKAGFELEVSTSDKDGRYNKHSTIDHNTLRHALVGTGFITKVEEEGMPGAKSQTEIVTNAGSIIETADTIAATQYSLLKNAAHLSGGQIDFDADLKKTPLADTNGMHLSISVQDEDGRNILHNGRTDISPLGKHIINAILRAQGDTVAVHAPTEKSYERFVSALSSTYSRVVSVRSVDDMARVAKSGAPGYIAIEFGKDSPLRGALGQSFNIVRHGGTVLGSICPRIDKQGGANTRIETRLASSSASPHVIAAITMGAVLQAVKDSVNLEQFEQTGTHEVKTFKNRFISKLIVPDMESRQTDFVLSQHARALLGEDLHQAICDMQKTDPTAHLKRDPDSNSGKSIEASIGSLNKK